MIKNKSFNTSETSYPNTPDAEHYRRRSTATLLFEKQSLRTSSKQRAATAQQQNSVV